jgi:flagellar biosynthesis protein
MAQTDGSDTDKQALAVALKYKPEGDNAPEVAASGRGKLAERILELAFAHDVKVREDADLAELLIALDVGDEIPVEAFAAVAEILAYVYRANGETPPEILAGIPGAPSSSEGQP